MYSVRMAATSSSSMMSSGMSASEDLQDTATLIGRCQALWRYDPEQYHLSFRDRTTAERFRTGTVTLLRGTTLNITEQHDRPPGPASSLRKQKAGSPHHPPLERPELHPEPPLWWPSSSGVSSQAPSQEPGSWLGAPQ
ncbi:hypothetical protein Taro_049804 [Colocasia esculenta]|uniref:Uncharacterized protein n=1 Tax=Colocasia esculenta TaxID=4460 RepID=A0A843XBR7_COLES|nr:hypothetical protein [Colocasia esculenta]